MMRLTKNAGEELRSKLQPGDQIIATKDARYSKHISPEEHYSQRVGDIIMVNNPNIGDLVGGTGITGTGHNGRKKLGLGSSLKVGTFRLANPDDPGFLATRKQWYPTLNAEIERLHRKAFLLKSALVFSLGAIVGLSLAL